MMYKRSASASTWKAFSQIVACQPSGTNRSIVSVNSNSKANGMHNTNNTNAVNNSHHSSNVETYGYYTAADIQKRLGIGRTKAYELINELNKKLEESGKIVLSGRIPKSFFNEQLY